MNSNIHLLFTVAAHLKGTTVTAATVVPMGRSVLYLWAFANAEGQENTLVIQQRERQWMRWRVFPGTLADVEQHYLRLRQERGSALPVADKDDA